MSDYSPQIITEADVRNFFTPPLDYNDVTKAEILLKIEAVEEFVKSVYFNRGVPSGSDIKIACLLLVASKIIQSPSLAKKYYTLSSESLGDYSYTLAQPISRGTNIQSSPFVVSKTWERMALDILNSRSTYKYKVYKVND